MFAHSIPHFIPLQLFHSSINLLHTFPVLSDALEILFVCAGLKPVARQLVPEEQLERVLAIARQLGVTAVVSDFKALPEDEVIVVPAHPKAGSYFLYFAQHAAAAQEAKFAEHIRHDQKLGKALGYPACCVDFYLRHRADAAQLRDDYSLFSMRNTAGTKALFYGNNLLRFFGVTLISHFPCSYHCAPTLAYAEKGYALVQQQNPPLAAYLHDILSGPVISHRDTGIHPLKRHTLAGNIIRYRDAWLTSQNTLHDVLQLCNTVEIIQKNSLRLCQDNHVVTELTGKDVGIMIFQ